MKKFSVWRFMPFWRRTTQPFLLNLGGKFDKAPKFDDRISTLWANSLYEIFYPIDMCCDRACNVPFIKVNDKGEELQYTPFQQAFMKRPNELLSFTQFLYNYSFNLMASGNAFVHYLKTGNNISYANVLNSDFVMPNADKEDSIILSKAGNIKNYLYKNFTINKDNIYYSCYLPQTFDNDTKLGITPLKIVERNINLLSAVYMARWNVYDNNGIAGIISKKASNENSFEIALDPVTQKSIADELLNEYKLTKHNNIKGISSIPLEFISTLATIKDLEPFREVMADAIAIAAVYGVKKELLGRETDTTFNNQRDAERFLWQNTIKSVAIDMSEMLERLLGIKQGEHIIPDFSKIEILQDDEATRIDTLMKKIEVYEKTGNLTGENYDNEIKNLAKYV